MLDFILSKMNLLILVVAMFSIVAFFSAGLSDLVKVNEANLILRQVNSMAESIANSNSSCDTAAYYLPGSLNTGGADFYYIMKISKVKLANADGTSINNVIFSMFPRMKQQEGFAANSFRTNAEVRIYSPDYIDRKYLTPDDYAERCANTESCSAVVDPQAQANLQPLNAVVFIKERIADGPGYVDYLHIIPCNVARCDDKVTAVARTLIDRGPQGKFLCGMNQGATP